jgi:hypothetical protein
LSFDWCEKEILQEICKRVWGFWELSAPFRICKLQIPLARGETDPVSGHHIESDIRGGYLETASDLQKGDATLQKRTI